MKRKLPLLGYCFARSSSLRSALMVVIVLCLSSCFVSAETYTQQVDLFIPEKRALSVSCASIINESIELSANLICGDHGLMVNASNISVDMNGYSIIGPGMPNTKSGISIPDSYNITISGPGLIRGFQSGIFASGSTKLNISSLFLEKNQIGIYLTGTSDSTLEQNMIRNNELGIAAHSSKDIRLQDSYYYGNSLAGVSLINSVDSSILLNYVNGSQNGIFTDPSSSSNDIAYNFLNNIIDINSANGLAIDVTNNTYNGNYCELSLPDGICRGLPDLG
jgi:parallel beta-helix repeat protein